MSDAAADHFFMKKLLAFTGFSPLRAVSGWLKRERRRGVEEPA